jgi:hypothetical protein
MVDLRIGQPMCYGSMGDLFLGSSNLAQLY